MGPRNKMIAKSCPKCGMQVAVASKSCKCGHTFFASRRAADSLPAVEDTKRRTGRVRRSQPQFYDAQHYQKQIKRRSPKKRESLDEDYKSKDKVVMAHNRAANARRRRALRRAARPAQPDAGAGAGAGGAREPQLKPAQKARALLVLQEINRKLRSVTWHPPATL